MARTLQVVESENILQLGVRVHNRAWTVLLAKLDLLHEEGLNVVWLFVAQQSGQVFEQFKDLVLSEVLVGISEHFIVDILQS